METEIEGSEKKVIQSLGHVTVSVEKEKFKETLQERENKKQDRKKKTL